MKNVSNSFKENIKKYGRQIDCKIEVGSLTIGKEIINSVRPSFNTSLFKSVMYELEIDSNVLIPKETKINVKVGIKFGSSNYEYINFNGFEVYSCERQEDTESYKIIAYDKMLNSMIDFDLEINEKLTVREYIIKVFQRLGWPTNGIPETFINSTKFIEPMIHYGIQYTFRDVLDELATITCSFILVANGIPRLKYITETNQTINEDYLSENDVTIGDKYFINSLVFGRAEESDNIYRKNDNSIEQYGLHEFRIADNQILSTNNRVDFIEELFNYLETISFYTFDVKSIGIMWFDAADKFTFNIRGNTYKTVVLNDEITIEQDIEEHLYTDEPEETETDYKCADETDRRINQTYILVDKQNQKITQLANKSEEYQEKLTQVEQDVDGIKQSVNNTVNYKREISEATEIHLENAGNQNILKFTIDGNKEYINNLYPRTNLYPRANLYPNQKGG